MPLSSPRADVTFRAYRAERHTAQAV